MGYKRNNRYKIFWILIVIVLVASPVKIGLASAERDSDSAELISAGDREFLSVNYSLAYEKYSLASVRNDKVGHYRVAMLLYFGYGVDRDITKARDLLEKSSKQGYVPAQVVVGILDKNNSGIQAFIDNYYNWLKASFEEDNIDGMFYFALIADQKAKYFKVSGPAMSPTLNHQEVVLVNLSAYNALHRPQKGDIIVLKHPKDPSLVFIKRVIATEEDSVEMQSGNVYVNGKIQEEIYVLDKGRDSHPLYNVPYGTVFVLGDNRRNSEDSRYFGCVPLELIQGKAIFVALPKTKYLNR